MAANTSNRAETGVRPTKAIVIAAGLGKRLRPYTDQMPKSMVPIAGMPMLVRTLNCLRNVGVTEFVIIRGYLGRVYEERIKELGEGITFVENADYESNNILLSLFKAEKELAGPLYITYSDIIFAQDVTDKLADAVGDGCLIVDKHFAKVYEGRTDHPLEQAELCSVDPEGWVKQVGKCSCDYNEAVGEFIGLAKFSAAGIQQLVQTYKELETEYSKEPNKPFIRAPRWNQSYFCDILEYMVKHKNAKFSPVYIEGRWREIDTVQDKQRADKSVLEEAW